MHPEDPGSPTASSTSELAGAALAARVMTGDRRAAARLIRDLDDGLPEAQATLAMLLPSADRAFVVGVTGAPGAGKSTLLDALVTAYRERGMRVGVLAVDPSSPLTGGAVLGDRVRMQRHATDPEVFIRSFATRGALGGLSHAVYDAVVVLDAAGFDTVLVETVGVGQDEVAIAAAADLTVVLTVPGLGDGVQAIKAGVLEVADILVVNKADHSGADQTVKDLQAMLEMRQSGRRDVAILKAVASQGLGVYELQKLIEAERQRPDAVLRRDVRRMARMQARLRALATARLEAALEEAVGGRAGWGDLAFAVLSGERSLRGVVDEALERLRARGW